MRKLASVQIIEELIPIKGADFIETAKVLGWYCVVKKGEFEVGDKCVYFEIDSILPPEPCFEFMKDRKYRVKTIKLRKQISQGLALSFDTLGFTSKEHSVGIDLTEYLGVTKHDPEGDKERALVAQGKGKKKPWWTRWYYGMKLWNYLNPRRGGWPEWIPKTDETRVQNMQNVAKAVEGRYLYYTEKIDGQSLTIYCNLEERTGIMSKGSTGVCSRNIHYPKQVSNNWWNWTAETCALETLEYYCRAEGKSLAIQFELFGEGIQGNKYELEGRMAYAFNVWDIKEQRYLKLFEKIDVLNVCGFTMVPVLVLMGFERTQEGFLKVAEGMSIVPNSECEREGIVVRDYSDDSFSFKAISNKWLLENE